MKYILIFVAIGWIYSPVLAQEKLEKWSISGVEFKVSSEWGIDEFSSSSVCDCEGVIINDYDTIHKFFAVIYPLLYRDPVPDHDNVWGAPFVADNGTKPIEIKVGGVEMEFTAGSFDFGDDSKSKALKLSSVNGKTSKNFDHIMYFFISSESNRDLMEIARTFATNIKWKRK